MRKQVLILIIVSFSLHSLVARPDAVAQEPPSTQIKGWLWGQVADPQGYPIASASITFSSEGKSIKVVADDQGKYQVELPAGVYRVTAITPGFNEYNRAPFRVLPNATKMLNIAVALGGFICILDVTGANRDPEKEGVGPPRYERHSLPRLQGTSSDLVVRFQLKRERRGITEYRGGSLNPAVMVSYDLIAIYARKVRINKSEGTVEAEGKVIVEDGKRRMATKYARLEIRDGNVELTTERNKRQ